MPQWKLYHIWMTKLTELRPGGRVTRLRNFTWLLVGMYSAQAVHLSKVAAKMPGLSCLPSRARRLSRLLDNPAIQTRAPGTNLTRVGFCNAWPAVWCT